MKKVLLVLLVLLMFSLVTTLAFAATCWDCNGERSKPCGWCGGDGLQGNKQCGQCTGKGKISCFKCGGSGTVDKN